MLEDTVEIEVSEPAPKSKKRPAEYYREWRAKRYNKSNAKEEVAQPKEIVAPEPGPVADVAEAVAPVAPVADNPDPTQPNDNHDATIYTEDGKPYVRATFGGKSEPESSPPIDISRPPKRLAARTKGIWQTLPEQLREDIVAREVEFDKTLKRFAGCGQFASEAEKNGTTLCQGLTSLVAMENKFRSSPIEAPMYVWNALGHDPNAMASQFVARFFPEGPKQAFEAGRVAGFQEGRTCLAPLPNLLVSTLILRA